MRAGDGRVRVVISGVQPEVDGGRFPIKRTVGEQVVVEADIFTDGHDALSAVLLYRHEEEEQWNHTVLQPLGNDRWRGAFTVTGVGRYYYTLRAQIDHFTSWRRDLGKRIEAGQDIAVDLLIGAQLIAEAGDRAAGEDARRLKEWANVLRQAGDSPLSARTRALLAEDLAPLIEKYPDQRFAVTYDKELAVVVDRERARFSTWYELFPRSCATAAGRHGTFKDCEAHLRYVASMGFDVLYLPPIHPIGRTHRKGKNNAPTAAADDPGSPWAIGANEGGHKAVHPQLGTLEDFRRLVAKTKEHGIEIALDLAFQCTPDHPYVKEHPEWFRRRPDGSIQYAENPPKKYQDIYPLDFETERWPALWDELKSIVLFWIDQGVRIFRVDNPHTKPFRFWEWLIGEVKKQYPEVIFLAEAFTRPKVMYHLAKLGFTQSYTYFTWRNTKQEITQYFTELTQTEVREYFRPNLWPNTPDILHEYLQLGGRPAFMTRLVLAATLGANYGIYGPAFELGENRPRELGSEEYYDSEKYEIKPRDLNRPDSLKDFIARVNRIRRQNPALQSDWSLRFHAVDNDQLICYSKCDAERTNVVLAIVNLDPHHTHAGWVDLSLDALGLDPYLPYQMHELLSDARYLWQGSRNYVELDPRVAPAHIFQLRRRVRTERDFDYYM
ncbi:MAG TPA: alpha-1,4-glucan--maltose-1-phosphate maltosyltransferase [Candidatus Binatia bacterium]|nr:alpha-1,4-glucan--maltose-1-phosphate maltosyltransferase [Candidatus Binatia bacterium]